MLSFFWRYISFFWYFCFTINCLWSILGVIFCIFISNFIIFWSSFNCICDGEVFGYIYCLRFYIYFYKCFCPYFQQMTKIRNILQIFDLLVELNSKSFLYSTLELITKLMFILCSISSASKFLSVNHTLIHSFLN